MRQLEKSRLFKLPHFSALPLIVFTEIFQRNARRFHNKSRERAACARNRRFNLLYNVIRESNAFIRCLRNRRYFKFLHLYHLNMQYILLYIDIFILYA